jgi:hypothetical protein
MSMSNTEKHVKDIRRKTRSIEGVSSSPFCRQTVSKLPFSYSRGQQSLVPFPM